MLRPRHDFVGSIDQLKFSRVLALNKKRICIFLSVGSSYTFRNPPNGPHTKILSLKALQIMSLLPYFGTVFLRKLPRAV